MGAGLSPSRVVTPVRLTAFATVAACCLSATAQMEPRPVGPIRRASESEPAHDARVAVSNRGTFVITWTTDADPQNLFVRRFDRAGNPIGPAIPANGSTPKADDPRIATDDLGRFVLVWSGWEQGVGTRLFERLFDFDGTPLTQPAWINTELPDDRDVAMDWAGNYVVVWEQASPVCAFDAMGQLFDPRGAPKTPPFLIANPTHGYISAAFDRGGDFVTGFEVHFVGSSSSSASTQYIYPYVYARRFDSAGNPKNDQVFVGYSYGRWFYAHPKVGSDAAGNYVVAWRSGWSHLDHPISTKLFDRFDNVTRDEREVDPERGNSGFSL
ncbi:MAG: hypothetical protein D6718_03495, partial [Acidobacteria bacterium]